MLGKWWERLRVQIGKNDEGYEALEYVLLATFIVIPLTQVVPFLVDVLRAYYASASFSLSLPFP